MFWAKGARWADGHEQRVQETSEKAQTGAEEGMCFRKPHVCVSSVLRDIWRTLLLANKAYVCLIKSRVIQFQENTVNFYNLA